MIYKELKIIFLSDMHLVYEKDFLGINTFNSFSSIVDNIVINHSDADYVIFGGDLVQDQTTESYNFFKSEIKKINTPKLFIRGNHDISDKFFINLQKEKVISSVNSNWEILFLNTYSKGNIFGEIKESDLDLLLKKSESHSDKYLFLYMHHNLFLTGSPWLDIHITRNKDKILEFLSKMRNLKIVVNGHIHQETKHQYKGINFVSAPSTSIQFTSNEKKFRLDNKKPGFLEINLQEEGRWEVLCHRVGGNFGSPEINPKSY